MLNIFNVGIIVFMMAGRFLSSDEVLMEVDDEGESSKSDFLISDDEEMDLGSDEDKTLLKTDSQSSD